MLTSLPTVNVNEHQSQTSSRQSDGTEERQIMGKVKQIDEDKTHDRLLSGIVITGEIRLGSFRSMCKHEVLFLCFRF